MKMETVWILTGKSESGDEYGPVALGYKPSDEFLKNWCFDCDGPSSGYEEEGNGAFGSYIHYSLKEVEII